MSMKSAGKDGSLRAFCDKHIPVSFAVFFPDLLRPDILADQLAERA